MKRSGSLFVLLMLVAKPILAQEEPRIDRIEQLVRSADFDSAESQARTALVSGKLNRREVARVYLLLGIIGAAKRADDPAQMAFRKALTLEPALTLPESAGPHIAKAFDRARDVMTRSPRIELSVRVTGDPSRPEFWVDTQLTGDGEGLVRRLRVGVDGVLHVRDLRESGLRFLESLPKSGYGCAAVTIDALDEHGNQLYPAVARTEVCPAAPAHVETVVTPPPPSDISKASSRPVPVHVWTLAAVTGVAAVTTGVLGTIALGKAGEYNDNVRGGMVDRPELETQRESAAAAEHRATAAAIVTGVAGAATVLLYLTRPERSVRAAAWVSPGTAMIFVSAGL